MALLYCIFEGVSNVRISLANAWPCEPDIEFPQLRRTLISMRECIRRCTIDAPELELEQELLSILYGRSTQTPAKID